MTPYEEKMTLPSAEELPGGVFPDEISAIKKKAREGKVRRLKIAFAVGIVLLVTLSVAGTVFLGPHVKRKNIAMTRSVHLMVENEIIEETVEVEVDKERATEIFRTVSSNGTSFVMRDMKTGFSAYKFDVDEKCYICKGLEESEGIDELLEGLEQIYEGEVEIAQSRGEKFLTVDEEHGQVNRSELSEGMAEFCDGLQAHWAVMSSSEATTEEEATSVSLLELLHGNSGTKAVHRRKKRDPCCCWQSHRPCQPCCSTPKCVRHGRWWGRFCVEWDCDCHWSCDTIYTKKCPCFLGCEYVHELYQLIIFSTQKTQV